LAWLIVSRRVLERRVTLPLRRLDLRVWGLGSAVCGEAPISRDVEARGVSLASPAVCARDCSLVFMFLLESLAGAICSRTTYRVTYGIRRKLLELSDLRR